MSSTHILPTTHMLFKRARVTGRAAQGGATEDVLSKTRNVVDDEHVVDNEHVVENDMVDIHYTYIYIYI